MTLACSNPQCECHSYAQNGSHTHCWNQEGDLPACGIEKENHKRCCLCPAIAPVDLPSRHFTTPSPKADWENEYNQNFEAWTWGQGSESTKIMIKEFIRSFLSSQFDS